MNPGADRLAPKGENERESCRNDELQALLITLREHKPDNRLMAATNHEKKARFLCLIRNVRE
jgi:hypothetical protein